MRLYDSLTRAVQEVDPIEPGTVKMYACGPTVYRYAHLGNLRSFMLYDLIRRALELEGFEVTEVMNITDVGHMTDESSAEAVDKMQLATEDEGLTPEQIAEKYTNAVFEDATALGIRPANRYPKATEHIQEMIDLTKTLVDKGHAYVVDNGSVYYDVTSFEGYGKLSGNTLDNLREGHRDLETDPRKRHPADFALWKAAGPGRLMRWPSPWGEGFPGWHIECSAMSMKYLGETFDIHAGGIDLVFPHHENEVAQSEGATGKPFVNYWIHFEHLKVEGETMSKSKGNYYTFRDIAAKGFSPAAIRYFLLSVPYNKQLNFTFDALAGAEKTVASLRDFRARLSEAKTEPGSNDEMHQAAQRALAEFEAGMDDDLNTSVALAAVHNLSREVNTALARKKVKADDQRELLEVIDRIDTVLNIFGKEQREMLDSEVQALLDERQEARRRRDFSRADEIRHELAERGIILEDTKDGVRWKRK